MKVAFVLGALNRGGAESLILDICRCANRTPFEVICIYRKEGNFSEEFHKTNARLIHIPKTGSMIGYMWKLRNVIRKERITIVHSQTPSNTLVLGLSLLRCNIKLMTTLHGHSFAHANYLLRKFVFLVSKRIIYVSKNQEMYYCSQWKISNANKLSIVYNGIDTSKIIDKIYPLPDFLRTANKDDINLVVVGSFCRGRSQDFILKVVEHLQVQLRNKHVKIFFVGGTFPNEDYRYQYCQQYIVNHRIEDLAIMLGVRKDVYAILQHVDGFLYATLTDTFGIAVVEAMLSGLPVLTNDLPIMKEVTHDGAFALLYQSNNVDDCAIQLLDLIDHIEGYKIKAKAMTHKVRALYGIENHIVELYKIYQSL